MQKRPITATNCRCGCCGPSGTSRCSRRRCPRSHRSLPERSRNMADITRAQVEDFLFDEADLLDKWQLPEWLELFTEDAEYQVPCMDFPADATPDHNRFHIPATPFPLAALSNRFLTPT